MEIIHFVVPIILFGFFVGASSEEVHNVNSVVADQLANEVRVLCGIVLQVANAESEAYVSETWGQRCNELVFLDITQYAENQTSHSTLSAAQSHCRHLYNTYKVYEYYDWFLLTDEHGYIIVENLRYMLANFNPSDMIYFMPKKYYDVSPIRGLKFILSKKSLYQFASSNLQTIPACGDHEDGHFMYQFTSEVVPFTPSQDLMMGSRRNREQPPKNDNCFQALGLQVIETRDSKHQERMMPLTDGYELSWVQGVHYDTESGALDTWSCGQSEGCPSEVTVAFEVSKAETMYVIDYLVYQLRPYGMNYGLPPPKTSPRPHNAKRPWQWDDISPHTRE